MSLNRSLAAVGFCLLLAAPAQAVELPIPVDKAAHFGLSYAIADQLMRAGMPPTEAAATTFAVGWLKELTDPVVDPYDLLADGLGCLAAGYLHLEFKF
ncbi:MAG TPA: hypothetical protein V6D47_21805 [Oscillatoriaceae cyanobacterium]